MMNNQFDTGMQEDFDNMTFDLGREVLVYPRSDTITYESQQAEEEFLKTGVSEVVFLQELDTTHQMVQSGQMNVGDARFTFQHDSVAAEEGYVSPDGGKTMYKILQLTYVRGQTNDVISYIKAVGKKVPNR